MSTDITPATEKTPADARETAGGGRIYRPRTDIVETDQCVSVMVEMPGVAADVVEITFENRVLTIRGKDEPMRPENLALAYTEYAEGDFERDFTLSENFDPDRIEAEMRGGVVTLTLPRAPEASRKGSPSRAPENRRRPYHADQRPHSLGSQRRHARCQEHRR
ncbi:Hsp20/alpha crystallin family protein [Paracoccus salipaludis]|uniref:Hsp20/alpha crystallin family protein n=1 Tax=Paracoccus salipaludis TaxID=2032623 RepID=UPI0010719210|nr:Hsp20/alpha crystallin family protein [Paracoccus salipaludis]